MRDDKKIVTVSDDSHYRSHLPKMSLVCPERTNSHSAIKSTSPFFRLAIVETKEAIVKKLAYARGCPQKDEANNPHTKTSEQKKDNKLNCFLLTVVV